MVNGLMNRLPKMRLMLSRSHKQDKAGEIPCPEEKSVNCTLVMKLMNNCMTTGDKRGVRR